jgi:hypothetical protein
VERRECIFIGSQIRQRPFIMLAKAALAQRLTSPLGAARSFEYLYITKNRSYVNGGHSEVPMRFGLELRLPQEGFGASGVLEASRELGA